MGHGPNPAGVDVLVGNSTTPQMVQLSRGAAIQDENGWKFICAWVWGGPELPTMLGANNDTVWIATLTGLKTFDLKTQTISDTQNSDLSASVVRKMVTSGEDILALSGFAAKAEIWLVSPGEIKPIVKIPNAKSVAALKEGFAAITLDATTASLHSFHSDGTVKNQPVALDIPLTGSLNLSAINDDMYLVVRHEERNTLYSIDGSKLEPIISTESPIHGPVDSSAGFRLFVVEHTLQRLEDNQLIALPTPKKLTCLRKSNGQLYTCIEPNIVEVGSKGEFGETMFDLFTIQPPNYNGLDLEQKTGCEIDWLDFATDAGLKLSDDTTPDEPPENAESTSTESNSGCDIGQSARANRWLWLVLVGMLLSLRRYGAAGLSGAVNSRRKMVRIRSKLN